MKKGDRVLFYHSVSDKQVMGIARVNREYYQDPTTPDERWVVVDLKAEKALAEPVSLEMIKSEYSLKDIALIRQSRLSVLPLTRKEFKAILKMGQTTLKEI